KPQARVLDGHGDSVAATVVWATADTAPILTVLDSLAGWTVVNRTGQTGRLVARSDRLVSNPLSIRTLAAADTLFTTLASTVDTVTLSADSVSDSLTVEVADTIKSSSGGDSLTVALAGRPVVYAITYPATSGPARARARDGRTGRHPRRNTRRVGPDRLRVPVCPHHRRAHLPDPPRQSGGIHSARRGCGSGGLLDGGPGGEDPRGEERVAVAPPRDRVRWSRGRRGARARRAGSTRPRGRRQISPVQGGSTRRAACRPRDLALHLWDDGAAQRRHADPRQHLLQRARLRGSAPGQRTGPLPRAAAAVAHPRADGGVLLPARGRNDQLRRVDRRVRAESAGRAAYHRRRGAARVREGLRPRARERPHGWRGEARHLSVGEARGGAVGGAPPGRHRGAPRLEADARDRGPAGVLE